jgi:hypothetical protein
LLHPFILQGHIPVSAFLGDDDFFLDSFFSSG